MDGFRGEEETISVPIYISSRSVVEIREFMIFSFPCLYTFRLFCER